MRVLCSLLCSGVLLLLGVYAFRGSSARTLISFRLDETRRPPGISRQPTRRVLPARDERYRKGGLRCCQVYGNGCGRKKKKSRKAARQRLARCHQQQQQVSRAAYTSTWRKSDNPPPPLSKAVRPYIDLLILVYPPDEPGVAPPRCSYCPRERALHLLCGGSRCLKEPEQRRLDDCLPSPVEDTRPGTRRCVWFTSTLPCRWSRPRPSTGNPPPGWLDT